MRIDQIVLHNYRQLRDIEFVFDKKTAYDLHLVIGRNGVGKSNLLNAINWCLYKDEPHMSGRSALLPLCNTKSIAECDCETRLTSSVAVYASTGDGTHLIIRRAESFKPDGPAGSLPKSLGDQFTVTAIPPSGDARIAEGEAAKEFVARIMPKAIRQHFFFDGERLHSYFTAEKGQNIRKAIYDLCQLELLDRIEKRLELMLREFGREAGRNNPFIDQAVSRRDAALQMLADVNARIRDCENQIALAKATIKEKDEFLDAKPDVQDLNAKRQLLKAQKADKTELLKAKDRERRDLLFEHGRFAFLLPPLEDYLAAIEEKKASGQVPPPIDRDVLGDTLTSHICELCGRELDVSAEERVRKLAREYELSNPAVMQLLSSEGPIRLFQAKARDFQGKAARVAREISSYEADLAECERGIGAIDKKLSGHNEADIQSAQEERSRFEALLQGKQRDRGALEAERLTRVSELAAAEVQLKQEMVKDAKVKDLRRRMEFMQRSSTAVHGTKQMILSEMRSKIETETKRVFAQLVFKQETFKDVRIDDEYRISVIHTRGYECLDSMSAAETELLALSFTLALHTVSGFDAPIFVDTPVAKVADQNKVNFGKKLLEVSTSKQTVLLFTSAEYTSDLSSSMDANFSSKVRLELSTPEEDESQIEVMSNA